MKKGLVGHVYVSINHASAGFASLMELVGRDRFRLPWDAPKLKERQMHCCVDVCIDPIYHRASFTMVGEVYNVEKMVLELVEKAFEVSSLKDHCSGHPRIGVVDNILLRPLGANDDHTCLLSAHQLAQRFVESIDCVKSIVYSPACTLATIRRATPYFQALSGPLDLAMDQTEQMLTGKTPMFSKHLVDPNRGFVCVGLGPWVTNFNMRMSKATTLKDAKALAKGIRERSGGLSAVEAVGLEHGDHIEIGCNLLDITRTPPEAVLQRISELAPGSVEMSYVINLSWDEVERLFSEV